MNKGQIWLSFGLFNNSRITGRNKSKVHYVTDEDRHLSVNFLAYTAFLQ